MELIAKVCPQCLSEFMPSAEICSDCNVPLVSPDEIEDEPEIDELPPTEDLILIRVSAVEWARGFSEALQDADIPHRIGAPPEPGDESGAARRSHDLGVAIYVRAEDREQGLLIDAEFTRSQIPDLPDEEGTEPPASDGESCPACGAAIAADDSECDSCGLPFIDLE